MGSTGKAIQACFRHQSLQDKTSVRGTINAADNRAPVEDCGTRSLHEVPTLTVRNAGELDSLQIDPPVWEQEFSEALLSPVHKLQRCKTAHRR